MIELNPEMVTIIMMGAVILGILSGFPIAFPILGITLIIGFLLFGDGVFFLILQRWYALITSYVLVAVPLFVFMGIMLEHSGIAERVYDALYVWFDKFRGGLAISTILVGTILAACVGVIGASVTMLALLALPAMVRRNYSKSLASGVVCAGGSLGLLIPPSVMLVVYGQMAMVSVGKLFMGAFIPGFLLAALYCIYIAIRCYFQRDIGPAMPVEEREGASFARRTLRLTKAMGPPALIILSVLGSIFFGIAPPTEAAAVGCLAAVLLAVVYRTFTFKVLKESTLRTFRVTSMMMFTGCAGYAFVGVFLAAGAGNVIADLILAAPGGQWGSFFLVMFIILILGFFVDWLGICFIMIPIIAPIIPVLGFDPIWFAMMVCINLQMSFLTPPLAAAIFYLRGSQIPQQLGVSTGDIIRGVFPFVGIVMIGLVLCSIFPQIILWLPSMMIK